MTDVLINLEINGFIDGFFFFTLCNLLCSYFVRAFTVNKNLQYAR